MGCIAGSLLFVEEYEEGLRAVGFENVSNTSKGIYFLGRLRDALAGNAGAQDTTG